MDERFCNGILGGAIAGIVKDIPNGIFHNWLKLTSLSFWDYTAEIALFRHPQGLGEQFYALSYEVLFSILLGAIYIYLKDRIKTGHYLIFGMIYGAMIWFIINVGILAFHIQALMNTDLVTSMVNSLCSIFYGWSLAYMIHYLEERRQRLNG